MKSGCWPRGPKSIPTAWRRSALLFAGRVARCSSPTTIWPISKSTREFSPWSWRAAGRGSSCASRTEACRRSAATRSLRWPTPLPGLFPRESPPRMSCLLPLPAGGRHGSGWWHARGYWRFPPARLPTCWPLLPSPPIALAMREEAGQLVIGWNARALAQNSRLEIQDGSERTILMLPADTSSATYGPQGRGCGSAPFDGYSHRRGALGGGAFRKPKLPARNSRGVQRAARTGLAR